MNRFFLLIFIFISIFCFIQCSSEETVILNDEKEMLSFVIPNKANSVSTDVEGNLTIKIYEYADITKLTPIVTVSPKAKVFPASGRTVDFTNPVPYTITAQNGSSIIIMVTVEISLSSEKELLSFVIPNKMSIAMTDVEDNLTVKIYEPIDITKLVPIVKVSPNAVVSPASGTTVDFTNPVQYTITAQDGSSKECLVTVEFSLDSDKDILFFVIPNKESSVMIDTEGNLKVKIYEPVDITKLIPVVKVSPNAVVFPVSGTTIDFTNPVQYTITAQDGSSKEFMVTIEVLLSSKKDLLSFAIPNKTTDIVIDREGGNILVKVYEYEDITELAPIITVSPDATISPVSGTAVNFTNPVQYTITAQNGSIAIFTVTVSKTLSSNNDIISITLVDTEQIFEREGDNLYIYTPYETNVTNIGTNIVVSDKATVSPANGAFINFTTPQIYTVRASDGATKNYLVTVKRSPWRKVGNGPFSQRDGAGLVEFKGKMWLVGGWEGINKGWLNGYVYAETNDVWNTSDGVNWQLISEDYEAPWTGRHAGGCVVYKDSIWIISGDGYADVWKTDDGKNWELVDNDPPWGKRYGPYVTVFNDKLWLIGGVDWWNSNGDWVREQGTKAFNDVWSSEDGKNWIKELEFAPFAQRGMIQGSVILNSELYIIGGGSRAIWPPYAVYNDIWKTRDGKTWTRVTHNAEWSPRLHHSVVIYNNKMWIIAGTSNTEYLMNDVWYSGNGGTSWQQQKYPFLEKTHAASFCVFQGNLYMVTGYFNNEIWVMEDI